MTQRKPYYKCRKCGIPYQKTLKCKICHRPCCKNCSVEDKFNGNICIDCFVERQREEESEIYNNEKYEIGEVT